MIRKATDADWPQICALRAQSDEYLHGISAKQNEDCDGDALVDDEGGKIIGVLMYHLAKPETWIRSVAVDPVARNKDVARRLISTLMGMAQKYGSSAVEGFEAAERKDWVAYAKKRGAHITQGFRVRYPLTNYTMQRAKTLIAGGDPDQIPMPKGGVLDQSSDGIGSYIPHNQPETRTNVVPPPRMG